MNKLSTRSLAAGAMIAALYTALCVALSPFSYGMVQVRAAEALTLLPVFSPVAIWGVTLGCALSNFIGFLTGMNILGFLDVFFGTAATLLAALASYRLRKVKTFGLYIASAIPPVILNAAVIGFELCLLEPGGFQIGTFAFIALYVGIGQMIACFALGLPMAYVLEKTGLAEKCFGPLAKNRNSGRTY